MAETNYKTQPKENDSKTVESFYTGSNYQSVSDSELALTQAMVTVASYSDSIDIDYSYLENMIKSLNETLHVDSNIFNLTKCIQQMQVSANKVGAEFQAGDIIGLIRNEVFSTFGSGNKTDSSTGLLNELLIKFKKLRESLRNMDSTYDISVEYLNLVNLQDFYDENEVSNFEYEQLSDEIIERIYEFIGRKEAELGNTDEFGNVISGNQILYSKEVAEQLRGTLNKIKADIELISSSYNEKAFMELLIKKQQANVNPTIKLSQDELAFYNENQEKYLNQLDDLLNKISERYLYNINSGSKRGKIKLELLDEKNGTDQRNKYRLLSDEEKYKAILLSNAMVDKYREEIAPYEQELLELDKANTRLQQYIDYVDDIKKMRSQCSSLGSGYGPAMANPEQYKQEQYFEREIERLRSERDALQEKWNKKADEYKRLNDLISKYTEIALECNYQFISNVSKLEWTNEQHDFDIQRNIYYWNKDITNNDIDISKYTKELDELREKQKQYKKRSSEYKTIQNQIASIESAIIRKQNENEVLNEKIFKSYADMSNFDDNKISKLSYYEIEKEDIFTNKIVFYDKNGNKINVSNEEISIYFLQNGGWPKDIPALVFNGSDIRYDLNGFVIDECYMPIGKKVKNNIKSFMYLDDYSLRTDILAYVDNTVGSSSFEKYFVEVRDLGNKTEGQRIANEWLSDLEELNKYDKESAIYYHIFNRLGAGFVQFGEGFKNLFGGADGIASPRDWATMFYAEGINEIYGDSAGFINGMGEVCTSIGNMLPIVAITVIATVISKGAGTTTTAAAMGNILSYTGTIAMGLSSAGNAMEQGLQQGMSQDQAITYGLLVGASEALLERFLGGITGVSDNQLIGKVLRKFNIYNAGTEFLFNLLSEGFEEFTQEILDPVFKLASGWKWEGIDWNQAVKSGIYGIITAGIMDGGSIALSGIGSCVLTNNSQALSSIIEIYDQNQSSILSKQFINDMNAIKNADVYFDEISESAKNNPNMKALYEQYKASNPESVSSYNKFVNRFVVEQILKLSTHNDVISGMNTQIDYINAQIATLNAKVETVNNIDECQVIFDEINKLEQDANNLREQISEITKESLNDVANMQPQLNEYMNSLLESVKTETETTINQSESNVSEGTSINTEVTEIMNNLSTMTIEDYIKVEDAIIDKMNNMEVSEIIDVFNKVASNNDICLRLLSNTSSKYMEKLTNKILTPAMSYYGEAAKYAKTAKEFETYRSHTEAHVKEVADGSVAAVYSLLKSGIANNSAYSSNINAYELYVAALWHDVGMAAGADNVLGINSNFNKKKGTYDPAELVDKSGNITRSNHTLNSALAMLANAGEISALGVDVNKAALLVFAHSKSNSGIKNLTNPEYIELGINVLQACVNEYNNIVDAKVAAGDTRFNKIKFDSEKTYVDMLVEEGLIESYTTENGKYKIKFNSDSLKAFSLEALSLRIGDANTTNVRINKNQAGEKIGYTVPESFKMKHTNYYDAYLLAKSQLNPGEVLNYTDFLLSIMEIESKGITFQVGNDSNYDANKYSKAYMLGENNIEFSVARSSGEFNVIEFCEIQDGNFQPAATLFNIAERIGEIESGANCNSFGKVVIKLDTNTDSSIIQMYKEAALHLQTKSVEVEVIVGQEAPKLTKQ